MRREPVEVWSIEDEELSRPMGPPMPDEVRWGAAAMVRGCAAAKVRVTSRVVTGMYDVALARHGVKVTQLLVLALLAERGGTSLRDLCVRLGTLESTSSRAVAIMVRNGWVVHEPAPRPRWSWLTLTEDGLAILERALAD